MVQDTPNTGSKSHSDEFGGSNSPQNEYADMPAEEREDKVLMFFVEHGFPLPPKALFRALKVTEDITFAYRTTQNILERLLEEGYVARLDKDKLDEGIIEPLAEDESDRRTYYFITEKGRDRLKNK